MRVNEYILLYNNLIIGGIEMKAAEDIIVGVRLGIPDHSIRIIEETTSMFRQTDIIIMNQISIDLTLTDKGLAFDVNLADTINGHILADEIILVSSVNNAEDLFNKIVAVYDKAIALTVTNMFNSLMLPLGYNMHSYQVNVMHSDSQTDVEITRPGGFVTRTYYGQSIDNIVAQLTFDVLVWNKQRYEA